jgi:hypothetical protein
MAMEMEKKLEGDFQEGGVTFDAYSGMLIFFQIEHSLYIIYLY